MVAQPQVGGSTVILNRSYTVTISHFPGQIGQSIQITQELTLAFLLGSAFGTYTVSGELIAAMVQIIVGSISVKSLLSQTESMGSVNYKSATSTVPDGGGASITPAPPNPLAPSVNSLGDSINSYSGVFKNSFVATSKDNKCQLSVNQGVNGLDAPGKPLSQIAITPVITPSPDSSVMGVPYDLGPNGATFTPPITLTLSYDNSSLPAGVNENSCAWRSLTLQPVSG